MKPHQSEKLDNINSGHQILGDHVKSCQITLSLNMLACQ